MHRLLAIQLLGCASTSNQSPKVNQSRLPIVAPLATIPLGIAQQHFHKLPVRVDGRVVTVAILDAGIGIELISKALCDRIKYKIDGSFPDPQIDAFVGLPFFETMPFTLDGPNGALTIESDASLRLREQAGSTLAIRLDRQGPALDVMLPIALGDEGVRAEVLVDTGNHAQTFHTRYAKILGIDLDDPAVRRREGKDETGHTYSRFFTMLDAPLSFAGAAAR